MSAGASMTEVASRNGEWLLGKILDIPEDLPDLVPSEPMEILHQGPFDADKDKVMINPGDRIAQLVFLPILRPSFRVVEEFSATTSRGMGGFGSTGV